MSVFAGIVSRGVRGDFSKAIQRGAMTCDAMMIIFMQVHRMSSASATDPTLIQSSSRAVDDGVNQGPRPSPVSI